MWIICIWLGDFFDDDEFFVYALEMMIAFNWNDYVRIYGNVVCLWWTCISEIEKGDYILFDEVKWNNALCANMPNWNCDICWWVLLY